MAIPLQYGFNFEELNEVKGNPGREGNMEEDEGFSRKAAT